MHRIRVWDLPTRLFHWTLAVAVLGLVVTANLGGNWMIWHMRLGYSVFALLLFRFVWGFVGGRWSRFTHFVYGPAQVLRYIRGQGNQTQAVGHSPLGALSVFALLFMLSAQVGTGLFSDDEIAFFGPLVSLVSSDTVALLTWYHKNIGKPALIGLVVLHILAVLYYRFVKRSDLLGAMIGGDKLLDHHTENSADGPRERLLAVLVLALCVMAVWWVTGLGTT